MLVRRFDAGTLGKIERTPAGGIKVPAYPTRVGVLLYKDQNGDVRRELRPPEEVFSPDSLYTLRHATVTDLHPAAPVTADNWRNLSVGHVGEDVRPEGIHVAASLVIQDANEIRLIEQRERSELSCGYTCRLEMISGEWEGEKYDAIQREIRYNHVALGPEGWGRAGSSVALHLDSGAAVQVQPLSKESETMKMRLDGKDYDLSIPAEKQAYEAALAKLQADKDAANGRADASDKTIAKLQEDLKAAKDPKALDARARTRADLLVTARQIAEVKGMTFDEKAAEGQSDVEMMGAMIMLMDPTANLEGRSEDYVRGMFGAYVKVAAANASKSATQESPPADGGTTGNASPPAGPAPKTDGKPIPLFQAREKVDGQKGTGEKRITVDEARRNNLASARDAWKQPLHMTRDK